MTVVLIDCKYIGDQLRRARQAGNMRQRIAADMLRISAKDLRRYERGTKVIPDALLQRMFRFGYMMLQARDIAKHHPAQ